MGKGDAGRMPKGTEDRGLGEAVTKTGLASPVFRKWRTACLAIALAKTEDGSRQPNRQRRGSRTLVPVVSWLEGTFDFDADVVRLLLGQLGQFDTDFLQVQASHLFVEGL